MTILASTLNGEFGLVCTYIGDRKDLELQTVENIIANAKPIQSFTVTLSARMQIKDNEI